MIELYNMENRKYYKTIQVEKKQVRLHRYLMEQKMGRKLLFHEIVHHKDGNIHNNNISNLELISRSDHMRIHKNIHEAALKVRTKYSLNYDEIYNLYIIKKLTRYVIAKRLKIPVYTITWYLDKNKIRRKPRPHV